MSEPQHTEIIEQLLERVAALERNVAELNVHQHLRWLGVPQPHHTTHRIRE